MGSIELSAIRDIPLFEDLSDEELEVISQGLTTQTFKRGEHIFRSGDEADRLFIVVEGQMKIYRILPDGREQVMYLYDEDDFVGAFNLIKRDRYRYNGQALKPSDIAMLSKEVFDSIALKNPPMLLKILEKSYERIRWAEGMLDRMSGHSTEQRVATLLLDLLRDYGTVRGRHLNLRLPMNREELGSYTGMTRETLTRKLLDFQTQGLIEMKGSREVTILEPERLRLLAKVEEELLQS